MFIDPITTTLLLRESASNESPPLILMYHGTTPGDIKPSSRYSTTANSFIDQINIIKNFGWNTVCIRDLCNPEKLPSRALAITFDDGYRNNYAGAYLPLLERGMCATWFIVSHERGRYARWMGPRNDENLLLSHEQLAEMAASGMEIGAHTRTHPDLSRMDKSEVSSEVAGSKVELEDELGMSVVSFAYPFGRWNEVAVDAVRSAGYTFACGVRPGWVNTGTEALLLRRVTVFADDTPGSFARKLVFATNEANWVKMAGYLAARVRDRVSVWR